MPPETNQPPVDTRIVNVGGQRLRVVIRPGNGTRPPLLLMNGIGVNLEVLQPFVNALDPAIEVIRFDVPGTGSSPAPLLPYPIPSLARLVNQLLDQLGYKTVDVLGISWGGGVAQQFAYQYPGRCRKLILVSTGIGTFMVPGKPSVLMHMATPRRFQDPAYMARIAQDIYGGKIRTQPELARQFAGSVQAGNSWGYLYQLLAGVGWTSLPWAGKLKQPVLILHGDDDPLVPLVNAKVLHRLIPHSKLYIFHDGHLGLGTSAGELAPVVSQFLAEPEVTPTEN